ncbi:MAG: polysaccharide deacetylase family protein [Calditrichaeota bacterium]|nr:polysaccharide deacetylase family protein [Calditrichota bacterium]HQU72395.1 polysaccharide deacetylase family protein [Calditrichia bacterium]
MAEGHLQKLSQIPVLMYHKIDPHSEVGINALSPRRFRQHCQWLEEHGFQALTFRHILENRPIPANPVILTFDDAYASVFEHAYPIMREFGFPGVVFVISGFIGRSNSWDANLGGLTFPHMDRDNLRELHRAGWEAGGHSVTHRALRFLPEAVCRREIETSFRDLESLLGVPPVSFAYPFGMGSERVRQFTAQAGFRVGCGAIRDYGHPPDIMNLPRIPLYQFEGARQLHRRLSGARPPLADRVVLRLLGWPAFLTPLYQLLFRRKLWAGDC